MLTREDTKHLAQVRSDTEMSLLRTVGPPNDVALLDAPALINVGDSMIWAGQLAYMKRLQHDVRYVSDMQSYDPSRLRRALPNGGVVLLRGGGNFGDIWVGHQNFREKVAQDLPDYQIVQLTQSVLFNDSARATQANRILSRHPSFRVLIRDERSIKRASDNLPDVHLEMSFDMALGWDPVRADAPAGDQALVIAREDREAASGLAVAARAWNRPYDLHVTDWDKLNRPARWERTRRDLRLNAQALRVKRKIPFSPSLRQSVIESKLAYLNQWNVDSAVSLFGRARAMVVDRLHAHVLASLLGIPHVVLDNDHGKISEVFKSYTGQFSSANYTQSPDEALDILDDLMNV